MLIEVFVGEGNNVRKSIGSYQCEQAPGVGDKLDFLGNKGVVLGRSWSVQDTGGGHQIVCSITLNTFVRMIAEIGPLPGKSKGKTSE